MKSGLFLLGVVACLTATIACAEQSKAHPVVEREVMLDGCHFKMKDPYQGQVDIDNESAVHTASYLATINPKANQPFETWIQFSCQNPVTAKTLSNYAGMKMTPNGWALDPSPEYGRLPQQHTTFYPLHGKHWDGGGVTQDQITGDEDSRRRIYAFCIPHNQLALCGVARPVAYLEHLNESVLHQVIKLLESIEFIDMPSAKPAAASSSSSPPQ
jgi:hypothetical protein